MHTQTPSMAATRMEIVIALVLVAAMWEGGMAKSSNCNTLIVTLAPCMDHVMGISKTASPKCCQEFGNVVKKQSECVCQAIGMEQLAKKNEVSKLPKACKIDTNCEGFAGAPAESPSGKEDSASGPSSSDKNSTSGSGSEKSDGNSIKLSFLLLLAALFIASYASTVRLI
ncbi:non-specific lipid transfer protein GPI-anchored 5-like [Cornus florida]|uniref:non-specific lipid transfer protein GPI-anchored 5-like n=1 Tax=Cornus florida TaxID=4283 RepID=UPI00289BCC24|nr:non-specific lipid transfer protein GPI-anchored 5-like [Cornus florida]